MAFSAAAQADGHVVEKVETYGISGQTGAELYASIGERGPKAGMSRAIAFTNFRLTWSRDYRPGGGGCTLVSARPKLVITYMLPKPAGRLPADVQQRWDTFIDGVRRHEMVHGQMIMDMVETIKSTTVGFTIEGDPKCRRIREAIKKPLAEASMAQRQKSRDFDKVELGGGGNVHRLILDLVGRD